MGDIFVAALKADNEIEEDCEPFNNTEDITSCKDFIPDNDEIINYSDSYDKEGDNFY